MDRMIQLDQLESMEASAEKRLEIKEGAWIVKCAVCGEDIDLEHDDYNSVSPNPYSSVAHTECLSEIN